MGLLFPHGFIIIESQTGKNRMKMPKGMQLTMVRRWETEEGMRGARCPLALDWEGQLIITALRRLLPQRSPQSGGETDPQQS